MIASTVAFAEWPNSHITPSPYESPAWERVRSQYGGSIGWKTIKDFWSPVGFKRTDYATNVIGLFSTEVEWKEYRIVYAYYFIFSSSQDRWMLLQNDPVELHQLLTIKESGHQVAMVDYKQYGAPFNCNISPNKGGGITAVTNYRRDNGSVFTVVYQTVIELDGKYLARRMPQ